MWDIGGSWSAAFLDVGHSCGTFVGPGPQHFPT